MAVGDEIRALDWTVGEVESIYTLNQPQLMYNLTVDTAHTFFVGEEQWLVHNSGGGPGGPCGRNLSDIGDVIDWGRGPGGADELIASIDAADDRFGRLLDDLVESGMTADEARWAADRYRSLIDTMQVDTPKRRAELMDKVAIILEELGQ